MPYDDSDFEGAQADTIDQIESRHDTKADKARKARDKVQRAIAKIHKEDDDTPSPSMGLGIKR